MSKAIAAVVEKLEALSHWEKLDDLSRRFKLPYIPEYDVDCFKTLYYPELRAALDGLEGLSGAQAHAWRGRLLRLLGDAQGASKELSRALDLDPGSAPAHAWLAEIDLTRPEALSSLARALELDPTLSPAHLYRGAARLLAGDAKGASADLDAFLSRCPRSALGHVLAGAARLRLGQKTSAARAFEAAAKAAPVCSAAHLLCCTTASSLACKRRHFQDAYNVSPVLGFVTLQIHRAIAIESPRYMDRIVAFCLRDPEQVGAYYKREATQSHFSHFPAEDYGFVSRLVKANPGIAWTQGFYGRAACYTPAGAPEGVKRLSRGIELAPQAGWMYAWRANARRVLGRYQDALADFNESARLQPFYHRAFAWRGSLYRKMGKLPEALADLDRALAMDPHYSLTWYERSAVLRAQGDFASSVVDLDRAFRLDARYRWVFKTGGEPTHDDLVKGLAELDRAIRRHPRLTSLWAWRGQLKADLGDVTGALSDLSHATQLEPSHDLAWAWYGWVLLRSGRAEAAVGRLKAALKLDPRLWVVYGWLAEGEDALGRRRQAKALLEHVLGEKPKTPWVYFLLAKFEAQDGRRRQALALLKRALLLDGKYPEAYLLLSQVKLELGDLRGALAAVEHCLSIAPNLGRAYVVRAAVHQKAGKSSAVIKDYRTALERFPYLFNPEQKAALEKELALAG